MKSRSQGVIFKILTFSKCPKKKLFLGCHTFWNLKPNLSKDPFFEMFGHLVFMFDWNFFYFAKIFDFIKDFGRLGQNGVKRPTI